MRQPEHPTDASCLFPSRGRDGAPPGLQSSDTRTPGASKARQSFPRVTCITLSRYQQAENASAVEPKSLADDEQQRIDVLMERIALLKEQVRTLVNMSHSIKMTIPISFQKENHFRKRLPKIQPKRAPAPKQPKATPRVDPEDEVGFWTTPTAAARTFKLSTGLLMDEHVDVGEMSMASFGSPPPTLAGIIQQPFQSFSHSINSQPPRSPESLVENATPSASPPPMQERRSPPLVPISPSPPPTPPSAPLISPPPDPEDLLPPTAAAASASPPRKGKIKITSDVDRIIVGSPITSSP